MQGNIFTTPLFHVFYFMNLTFMQPIYSISQLEQKCLIAMQHPRKKKNLVPARGSPSCSVLSNPPPPPTPYNLQQMFHDPSLSQSRFLFRFLHPNLNIAQNFHCACATNLWMHALFTTEHQHSPNYFLIFQSSSAFLLLVLALSRLVVEKHKLIIPQRGSERGKWYI